MLLLVELLVPAVLLLHDLSLRLVSLFHFALSQQFDVLVLQLLIHLIFLYFLHLAVLLFVQLLFQLLADKSFALFVSKDCLFLLFVVEQCIKLLYGSPLVILVNLRVNLSLLGL